VHGCAADQDALRLVDIVYLLVFGSEILESDGGNIVKAVKFIHFEFSLY
jgi:hypothetical protein